MSLTVVGLGPGIWESLTGEAIETLQRASAVYVRSKQDVDSIRSRLTNVQFLLLDVDPSPEIADTIEREAQRLIELAHGEHNVVLAIPGTPVEGDAGLRLALRHLSENGDTVSLVQGVGLSSLILAQSGGSSPWIETLDAGHVALMSEQNALGEVAGMPNRLPWRASVPTASLIILGLRPEWTEGIAGWLGHFYPPEHSVLLVTNPGTPSAACTEIPLSALQGVIAPLPYAGLFVPPVAEMDNRRTFPGLMELTRTLRAPGGCPWDREQTHASLKPHLLEETYEVLDALDSDDPELVAEEMGDLLFQITIHSQVAAENGTFSIEDVISNIMTKLIGRHPHVFGDLKLESAQDVRHVWESLKQREKPKRTSVFEQIPRGLPALPQSNLMQKRAAGVGFEWPSFHDVLAKVEEELHELRQEVEDHSSQDMQREEFGDILFAMVSLGRHLKLDPEESLRLANRKFATRFSYVESRVLATGRALRDLSPQELDVLWEESKKQPASD